MRTTIDKAGRVVIPAQVRERAGLSAGAELEVIEDETGIRLERVAAGPRLVKVGRRLVARPTVSADARPPVDIAALVEDERNRWPERLPRHQRAARGSGRLRAAGARVIVTDNRRHFLTALRYDMRVQTPAEFLAGTRTSKR